MMTVRLIGIAALLALFATPLAIAAEPVDFAHDVVPILRQHCGQCHTGDKKKGGLSLNTRIEPTLRVALTSRIP